MSNQVFISYSSNDLQTADKVCVLLEAEGIGCWIAPRDVLPGTIYAEEIIKAIENTEALVLICSRFTADSVHVRSEVEHAFSQKKVIFPVRMEDVGLGKALEYFLGSSHWLAAWDSPLEECVKRLAESIKKVLVGEDETVGVEEPGEAVKPEESMAGKPVEVQVEHPNNLPAQTTRLIGRLKEVGAARRLLMREEVRLVTLTGPGGTGKTRLSLQTAADVLAEFKNGVFFVALAPIIDENLVTSTIAQALGIPDSGSRSVLDHLKSFLKNRQTLLVLDNFEQVISAAPAIAELLTSCPRLKVIATSRAALHLSGEHDFPVPPLTIPEESLFTAGGEGIVALLTQFEAVKLFIERAVAVKPDFVITNENAPSVAEICYRLDGLPLAIELAVARIRYLTPQIILSRLKQRLPVLGTGARDLPNRQRTLEGTIQWSYDLLDGDEKALFRRLAVFAGGCAMEAAEEVCGTSAENSLAIDVFDIVGSLVAKSLVKEEEIDGEPWFFMLETIREYAINRLDESGEGERLRRRHAEYYLMSAERAEIDLRGPKQAGCLRRLKRELDNFRSALEWGIGGDDPRIAVKTGAALWWFFFRAGFLGEGQERLTELSKIETELSERVYIKLIFGSAFLAAVQGSYDIAENLSGQALKRSQDFGDNTLTAWAYWTFFASAFMRNDTVLIKEMASEALATCRRSDDRVCVAEVLRFLGWAFWLSGDIHRGEDYFEEGIQIFTELGDDRGIGISRLNYGQCLLVQGEYQRSRAMVIESLLFAREVEEKWNIAWCFEILASLEALGTGRALRASRLLGASQGLFEDIGAILAPMQKKIHRQTIDRVRAALGTEAFDTAWREGSAMTLDRAIEYALRPESDRRE